MDDLVDAQIGELRRAAIEQVGQVLVRPENDGSQHLISLSVAKGVVLLMLLSVCPSRAKAVALERVRHVAVKGRK